MLKYNYNEELEILEVKIEGDVQIDVVINHYLNISLNTSLPKNIATILDATEATFNFDVSSEEFKSTRETIKISMNAFESMKEAILVSSPTQTAKAFLFRNLNESIENYNFEVFSTREAALNWLK